jgi:hypothetical protein
MEEEYDALIANNT